MAGSTIKIPLETMRYIVSQGTRETVGLKDTVLIKMELSETAGWQETFIIIKVMMAQVQV